MIRKIPITKITRSSAKKKRSHLSQEKSSNIKTTTTDLAIMITIMAKTLTKICTITTKALSTYITRTINLISSIEITTSHSNRRGAEEEVNKRMTVAAKEEVNQKQRVKIRAGVETVEDEESRRANQKIRSLTAEDAKE